ncbi:DUF6624 domain-containing protein [Mucilaginibacter sp. UR6-11]|uniref:DUF6624 domain-containing protein n=1 Tax=Mucilaginibacter sp. UR6-11 TaxID=1435644 RepID=UPI001E4E2F82|nr:DUF6624 domain-containing protein [Mucilaginibacter sp. UR6-11]MCC8424196.1 hypothetical protein [Mucilaginibacter sp. UR6-11]
MGSAFKYFFILVFFLNTTSSFARDLDTLNRKNVNAVLERLFDNDQNGRDKPAIILKKYGADSKEYQQAADELHKQDSINQKTVFNILDKYGWLPKSEISSKASNGIFYVIQHAGLDAQIKYEDIVMKAYSRKQIGDYEYAIFIDRLKMFESKNQIYGTQLGADNIGNLFLYPVEDTKKLDAKRKLAGLEPLEKYVKENNVRYYTFPPKKNSNDILLIGHTWDANNKGVKNIAVILGSSIVGKSDENGFFYIYVAKPKEKSITVILKQEDTGKQYTYTLSGDKDFYEIRRQFK